MASTTSRLGLQYPQSSDNESAYPAVSAQQMGVLDNAALYTEGNLVDLPAAGSVDHGHISRATDKNTLQWSNGSVWAPVGLTWALAGGSTVVVNGQILNCAAGITITLPTPALNSVVGIAAQSGVSGASPVTVSGTNIFGVGMVAVSSFALGTPQTTVILQSDGTNWIIISGQQDTGWIALSLGSGMGTNSGAYTPSVRQLGDRVFFKGAIAQSSGNAASGLATLPAGITKPANNADPPGSAYNGSSYVAGVYGVNPSTGAVGWIAAGGAGSIYFLDGLNYSIS